MESEAIILYEDSDRSFWAHLLWSGQVVVLKVFRMDALPEGVTTKVAALADLHDCDQQFVSMDEARTCIRQWWEENKDRLLSNG